MSFHCNLEQPYFCWWFGLLLDIFLKLFVTFIVLARRAQKKVSTQRAIKGKQNGPRVFLHHLVFSVRYFCNDLSKGQDKKQGIFTPSNFQCMVPCSVLPKVHFIPSRVSAEGIYIIMLCIIFIPSITSKIPSVDDSLAEAD